MVIKQREIAYAPKRVNAIKSPSCREWYGLDEGYDETHNPFANVSAEYTRKKEEAAEAKKVKRLTAKQAQRNKDNEMWEKNRMFRSGAVTRYYGKELDGNSPNGPAAKLPSQD